jgi:glycoside transferase family 14
MSHHALLIISHEKPAVLRRLVAVLDHPDNDVFIHIDKKCDIEKFQVETQHSRVVLLDNRIDGRWGDYSLVEIELNLIAEASKHGVYDYLHLISGVDYPVKSMQEIHDFCNEHNGAEFIGIAQNVTDKELNWRSQHYFLFSDGFKSTNPFKRVTRALFARLQSVVGYKRYKGKVVKGAQWWSITYDFAAYLLQHRVQIERNFRHTYCPDELVVQTMCWNSPFRERIYNTEDEFEGCKRYIPWHNGYLAPFASEDFIRMKDSGKWFGRKFTEEDIDRWVEVSKSR